MDFKDAVGETGTEHGDLMRAMLNQASRDIEQLAGRAFGPPRMVTWTFDGGGWPFVEVPDLRIGSSTEPSIWPIPDPVRPKTATVWQVGAIAATHGRTASAAGVIGFAGALVAECHARGLLLGRVGAWLDRERSSDRPGLARRLLDPSVYAHAPIVALEVDGWWVQVSRRVRIITADTPLDDPRLYERLSEEDEEPILVAAEPSIIVAKATAHPSPWAMAARAWVLPRSSGSGIWRLARKAVYAHGIPILTLDENPAADARGLERQKAEASAQLLLSALRHGYLTGGEPELLRALQAAFPRAIARIRVGGAAADDQDAAAALLERLVGAGRDRPGFDPTRGAGSARWYVASHATTIVNAHRTRGIIAKADRESQSLRMQTDRLGVRERLGADTFGMSADPPWTRLGTYERDYYRLVAMFAPKDEGGRYVVGADVLRRIKDHLDERRARLAAVEFLVGRGFTKVGARKWLQRHPRSEIRTAEPKWHRAVRATSPPLRQRPLGPRRLLVSKAARKTNADSAARH